MLRYNAKHTNMKEKNIFLIERVHHIYSSDEVWGYSMFLSIVVGLVRVIFCTFDTIFSSMILWTLLNDFFAGLLCIMYMQEISLVSYIHMF